MTAQHQRPTLSVKQRDPSSDLDPHTAVWIVTAYESGPPVATVTVTRRPGTLYSQAEIVSAHASATARLVAIRGGRWWTVVEHYTGRKHEGKSRDFHAAILDIIDALGWLA